MPKLCQIMPCATVTRLCQNLCWHNPPIPIIWVHKAAKISTLHHFTKLHPLLHPIIIIPGPTALNEPPKSELHSGLFLRQLANFMRAEKQYNWGMVMIDKLSSSILIPGVTLVLEGRGRSVQGEGSSKYP